MVDKRKSLNTGESLVVVGRKGASVLEEKKSKMLKRKSFCRGCLQMFERQKGRRKYCSQACAERINQGTGCGKVCQKKNMRDVPVTFRNGSQHVKRVCESCGRGSYVSKYTPEQKRQSREHHKEAWAKRNNVDLKARFFLSREWAVLRYRALLEYGKQCMNCGETEGQMHVDHIKPRSKYPELALEFSNLQVLCKPCNLGKGAWDETDFREHAKSSSILKES